ncbi:MAG: SIP domain-containing protein [Paracoccus sp. (in: a-proteobacteria)]|uniref:SIP domain-containing protein n=1 Tax=Paracoccus sp. TaxID=267 RepID=UPI004057D07A
MFGDETALPAIARMLDLTRAPVQVDLRSAAEDLGPLAKNPAVRRCDDLIVALKAAEDFDSGNVRFAATTAEAREAQTLLLRRRLPKTQFTAAGYWAGRVD